MNLSSPLALSALVTLAASILACSADAIDNVESAEAADSISAEAAPSGYGYEFVAQNLAPNQPAVPASPSGLIPADRIAPEVVLDRVREHLPELRGCYSSALERDPSLRGEVVVVFRVDPAGIVKSSKIDRSSVDDAALGACLAAELRTVSFPASPGGTMQVYYPVNLAPEDLASAK